MGRLCLPYCIEQVQGTGYVVLNRLYKPPGISSRDHVDYRPHAVRMRAMTAATAAALSCNASSCTRRIYLYKDAALPERNSHNWALYQERLAILAGLYAG